VNESSPATVLTLEDDKNIKSCLEELFEYIHWKITMFDEVDDVFTTSYAETIILRTKKDNSFYFANLTSPNVDARQSIGVRHIMWNNTSEQEAEVICDGPYIVSAAGLRRVYRCWVDSLLASITPVVWP
jgi:hypothetical protein